VKVREKWWSQRCEQEIRLARWGHFGTPVLVFPTAGGDYEEIERFHLVDACGALVEAGRVKIYSVDSLAGRAWLEKRGPRYCSWLQTQFDAALYTEVLPAIRTDCRAPGIEPILAGASIGAYMSLSTIARHPDAFRAAVCLSGTYDLEHWLEGQFNEDFYFSSPLHFVPGMQGAALEQLRRRFVVFAFGQGRWEEPGETWNVANLLGKKGVPNRVDPWGREWDHDWPTWRNMLPKYLHELTA
jgi:esterase/lipase superfamily enzyme